MELQGSWEKDEEGYLEFDPEHLHRLYENITESYYLIYQQHLDELDDEEEASAKAKAEGYEMLTDYKIIDGREEFATTYHTPSYVMDLWYLPNPETRKKDYNQGFIRISRK